MFLIKKFRNSDQDLYEKALAIRRSVFVEEQGVDPALEFDHEEESEHFLLLLGEKPVATARWRETGKGIKLERFAVVPGFRNRGFGGIILKNVMQEITGMEKPIYLHAQLDAVEFYRRNGFFKVGEPFVEAGISHYLMQYPD